MSSLNQDLITIILLAVFLFCAIGVILIGNWVYKNGPLSKKQERISRFVASSLDDSQVTHARDSLPPSKQVIGKFRDWINESLSSLSSDKLQVKLSGDIPICDREHGSSYSAGQGDCPAAAKISYTAIGCPVIDQRGGAGRL